jgi:integrase
MVWRAGSAFRRRAFGSMSGSSSTGQPHEATSRGQLSAELSAIAEALRPTLAFESVPRTLGLVDRFGRFVDRAFGVRSLGEVEPPQVEAFVRATGAGGAQPSVATMRLRRSVLRSAFRVGRDLGFVESDPTVDVVLPSRTSRAPRPLTDLEVQRCRRVALEDLTSTRLAIPWALGESTARTGEIPYLRVGDLDLERRRVWIHGSTNTDDRWGALTAWGTSQIERHLRDHSLTDPVAHLSQSATKNRESRRAHSSQAVRETLERSGLLTSPDVRPASLAAWAGQRVLSETGRIDDVARALGMRSLDGAARLIGWDWATNLGDEEAF